MGVLALTVTAFASHGSQYIDLTTVGAQVTHNNVIFAAGVGPAGTGQFDPFLTVSPGGSTPTEVGYNSDAQGAGTTDDTVQYGGNRTHTLRASAIPPTVVGGIEYREFSLDGNDQGSDDFMSIDNIEVYIDTQAGIKGYTDGAGCTPGTFTVGDSAPAATQIYCLDAGQDVTVLMKTQGLSSGSGQSDITVLIPASIFPAECNYGSTTCNKWVTFWFEAGFAGSLSAGAGCTSQPCNYDVTSGFEEWRTRKLPVVNIQKTANPSLNRSFDWTVKKYVSTDDSCTAGFLDAQDAASALNINLFNGQSDTVCWKIEPDRGAPVDSNQQLTGTITLHNPTGPGEPVTAPIPVTVNTLTDVVSTGSGVVTITCPGGLPQTLDPASKQGQNTIPGETLVCTYSSALASSAAGTNTATANVDNGTAPDIPYSTGPVAFDPAAGTINLIDESASLDDDRKPSGFPQTFTNTDPNNTPITYTESLSCPSSRTVSNTAVLTELDTSTVRSDPAFVSITCNTLSVSKNASTTFTRTFDWTVKKYVAAGDCTGSPTFLDAQDAASALNINLFNGQSADVCWKIEPDRGAAVDSAWAVSGTITISNSASIAANGVSVSDAISGGVSATVDCDGVAGAPLTTTVNVPAASGGTPGTASCTYSASLPDGTSRTNTATASLAGQDYTGTAAVTFGAPTTVTDESASLDDDRGPNPPIPASYADTDPNSTPVTYTESLGCPSSRTVTNTADLTEADTSTHRTDPANVVITCHGLTVAKTASPTYTRSFDWTVKKYVSTDDTCTGGFVDGTLNISLNVGQSDTVCWKIEPDRGPASDSAFAVTGTITITNNAPIAANNVAVSDAIAGFGAATVDCGSGATTVNIAASSSAQCSYSATLPDATDRNNTATAALAGTNYTGSTLIDFGAPTTVTDESASLDDDRKPSGFPQAYDNTDPNNTPVTYTEVLTCGESRTESNTADLTETDTNTHRTDPAAVALECIPPSEGCTPGFWKNHEELWDSVNDPVVDNLIPPLTASALPNPPQFTYNPNESDFNNQLFRQIFGLTAAEMTNAGLDPDLTLLEALNTGGGQFEALVRHGTAALLSSEWVNYPHSASFVLNGVQDAFQAGDYNLNNILTQLTAANNLDESACLTGS